MKLIRPLIFSLAILITIVFLIKIISTGLEQGSLKQEYINHNFNFSILYDKKWTAEERNGAIILTKQPLKIDALLSQNYNNSDCAILINPLKNTQDKTTEEYFSTERDIDSIKLGENHFTRTISEDTGQIISYAIQNKSAQILNFSGINLGASNCREEMENMLSTLQLL